MAVTITIVIAIGTEVFGTVAITRALEFRSGIPGHYTYLDFSFFGRDATASAFARAAAWAAWIFSSDGRRNPTANCRLTINLNRCSKPAKRVIGNYTAGIF